jgi:uncharacterized repeat protein (TIGR01451 family)
MLKRLGLTVRALALTLIVAVSSLPGGFSIEARALPQFAIQNTSVDDSVGGNGNKVIDPGETISLTVTLKNTGPDTAVQVSGILTTSTAGITVTNNASSYPNILPGNTANNSQPFTFSVSPAVTQGTTITFRFFVISNGTAFELSLTLKVLQLTQTSFASSDVTKQIPDLGLVGSNLIIQSAVDILDVDVELTITHNNDSDLAAYLISPSNQIVKLFGGVGGTGNNFLNTTLDDEASLPISFGNAPFNARFRPEEPLAALDGESSFGVWTLAIRDTRSGDAGTLVSWRLIISSEAPPTRTTMYESADVPKEIVDIQASPFALNPLITSKLVVADKIPVSDINVRVSLNHPTVSELNINLVAPDGTRVQLVSNAGGGANFTDTIFDDEATRSIVAGSAPHTGRFKPQGNLSVFETLTSALGTWTLEIRDTSSPPNTPNLAGARLISWDLEIITASGGTSKTPYDSTDVPQHINESPGGGAPASSSIIINDNFTITDLDVLLTITHNRVADLDITLVGPDGTRVQLVPNGATGANFIDTIFDNEGASIGAGSAPYSGHFRPSGNLSQFDSKSTAGTWRLEMRDRAFNLAEGDLLFWRLIVSHN